MSLFKINIEEYHFEFKMAFNRGVSSISNSNFSTKLTLNNTNFYGSCDNYSYDSLAGSATFKMNFVIFYTDGTNLVVPIVEPIQVLYRKWSDHLDYGAFLISDDIGFDVNPSVVANITINPQKNIKKIGIKATLYNRVIEGMASNDIAVEEYHNVYSDCVITTTSNSAEFPTDFKTGFVLNANINSSYTGVYTLPNPITNLKPNTTYNLVDYTTYPKIYQFTTLKPEGNIYFKQNGEYKLGTIYVKDAITNTYKIGTLYRKTNSGYIPV